MARLFPVAVGTSTTAMFSEASVGTIRFTGASQASDGYTTVTNKKRKFGTPGRPVGAVNKAKTIERDADTRTISFTPQIDLRRVSETPTSTQRSASSKTERQLTPSSQ